jgi:2-polyprenyl-3-methyl-5-hydroxy-6-metoxy-1,4-benzoquinol methylase
MTPFVHRDGVRRLNASVVDGVRLSVRSTRQVDGSLHATFHYWTREEVKQRFNICLPLLDCVASGLRTTGRAFDLGCGRGEWPELLSEHGWRVTGVDLNADTGHRAVAWVAF